MDPRQCRFALALVALIALPSTALAAGFEVGEHTPRSLARGGTGVVNTADPSTLYFNPARLPSVEGHQILGSVNIWDLDATFQRDDFVYEPGAEPQSFELAENQTGPFPIPFLAAAFDLGRDDLSAGVGIFTPPAFGNPCWGDGDDCEPGPLDATRGMVVESDMAVVYFGGGIGKAFDLGSDRQLDIGLTAALAYQFTDFSVAAEADIDVNPPWEEDPESEAFIRGQDLTGIAPTGILGIAYTDGPFRIAASYRPPTKWNLEGEADVRWSKVLVEDLELDPALSDDRISLETWQAGTLRLGWGVVGGQHPRHADLPRWDLEFNTTWENWSMVDHFRLELFGGIEARALATGSGDPQTFDLNPIYQRKGYQDAFSLRSGFSFAFNSLLTGHIGGALETAAQPIAYTSADFLSWERYTASLGATLDMTDNLRLDLAYAYIHSPDREVRNGEVYNPIPLSSCRGPDYRDGACQTEGTPPGNPQNEGLWTTRTQVFGAGLNWRF